MAHRRFTSTTIALAFTASAALAACGNDLSLLDSGPQDARTDRGTDTVSDTLTDVTSDTAMDAGTDIPVVDVVTDTGTDAMDSGTDTGTDAGMDVVTDTGVDVVPDTVTDTGTDAPTDTVVLPDVITPRAGRCTPTIDGTIGTDWTSDAIVETNTTATAWGVGLNEINSVRVCYDANNLYFGVSGAVEAGNAIVGYIDRDYNPPGGAPTGVALFSALTDNSGQLDDAISASLTLGVGAGNFGAEAAWGTAGMASVAANALDAAAGLRLIAPGASGTPDRRSDFAWTMGSQTACNAGGHACEVSIAWTSLFEGARPATGRIAVFFRLNNGDGSMSSNQTIPEDDPSMPRTVSRVLVVDYLP